MMGRKTQAIIDLDALQANLQVAKSYAGSASVIAIIKANAYGHGVVEVAKALHQADMFGVASLEEAIELRLSGADKPILLLSGFHEAEDLEEIASLNLHLVIHCQQQLDKLLQVTLSNPVHVWLKMDTGMHRLGLGASQIGTCYQQLQQAEQIASIRLMSHFACADQPENPLNQQQLEQFQHCISGLQTETSLCNSAALVGIPEARGDWVRPGIMLYGCNPFSQPHPVQQQLTPVMCLQSRVIALRHLPAGASIGYGQNWTASRDSLIATLAIGYGDGYPRHAPNGTPVLIRGQRAPLVGTVSMDMITVDVTDISDIAIDDKAILWGPDLPVDEIAELCGTISYELLTGISQRVGHQYLMPHID